MKRYERFANLLNTMIDSADLHKNEMIRNLDIDRSSYFQILRGDRLPTRSQYRKFKRILVLEKDEEISLDDLYDRMALGEDACDDIALVRSLLQQLADAQTGTALREVENRSYDILNSLQQIKEQQKLPAIVSYSGKREVEAGIEEVLIDALAEGVLDFCMPSFGESFFSRMDYMLYAGNRAVQVRQLLGLPGRRIGNRRESASVFRVLQSFFLHREDVSYECRFYYSAVNKTGDIGVLYPWYVLGKNCMLLINADLRSAVCCREKDFVDAFRTQFVQAFESGTPLVKNYGALDQNLRAIRGFLRGTEEVNYEATPCIGMMATPEVIRKCIIPEAQEALIEHCEALQRDETMVDLVSFSGLRLFLKTGMIPEIPPVYYRQTADTETFLWYLDILLERLGKTLFFIDETRIPAVHDWDITVIEGVSVLIHHHNFDTVILDEKNIVDIFTSFVTNIRGTSYIMDEEVVRKELLDIRAELLLN